MGTLALQSERENRQNGKYIAAAEDKEFTQKEHKDNKDLINMTAGRSRRPVSGKMSGAAAPQKTKAEIIGSSVAAADGRGEFNCLLT